MLKKLFTILLIFTTISVSAQNGHDERLLERYSADELTELKTNTPEEYTTLVKALETGISIGKIPSKKEVKFDGEIEADLSKEQTYISLGIELKENVYQYFKIKGTDKMVIVRPKAQIYKYL
jgi:hypothetical protein